MLIQTHLQLATTVYQHVKSKYNLELRHDMLQYGSIKPDLLWQYRDIPHYFEEGFPFFLEELQQMCNDRKYDNVKDFSMKLGEVLHFTADYFCYAHNEEYFKKALWPHFIYELKLHNSFSQYTYMGEKFYLPKFKNILSLILNLRRKYLETSSGLKTDVKFIHISCLEVTNFLIKAVFMADAEAA